MEGVIDFVMREILTASGAYDYAVTEFLRVNDHLLSESQFYKYSPELTNNGNTTAGTPVYIQLLGQDKNWLAENAMRAYSLGAPGIDLNFGCPAKTVNNNRGGSILLREPECVHDIVKNVREAVSEDVPVTVKMRLGYEDKTLAIENAQAIQEAGATRLAIHARTKLEGYQPPAHWHWIAKIKAQVDIPLVANGDIWSAENALSCQQESGCKDIMIGRGALALPNLGDVIRSGAAPDNWQEVVKVMEKYALTPRPKSSSNLIPGRIKQWFVYLKRQYYEAAPSFEKIKRLRKIEDILTQLRA